MRHIFGQVTTCSWKQLPELRRQYPNIFVVKVCNTAHGYTWDYDITINVPEFAPLWENINKWNASKKLYTDWHTFEFKYTRRLDGVEERAIAELNKVFELAGKRIVVFCCHEEVGHCHRYTVEGWGFEHGVYNAILNRDSIICSKCYNSYADNEMWTENECNLIMGYVRGTYCDECQGIDDDGIYEFGKEY